jgi:hypothetical protein
LQDATEVAINEFEGSFSLAFGESGSLKYRIELFGALHFSVGQFRLKSKIVAKVHSRYTAAI